MKTKIIIYCLCVLVALSACTKSAGPSSVSGQVIDKTTGKGVSYADVYIVGNGGTIGATGNKQNGYAKADANGNFSINFDWASGNYYNVTADAQFYYSGAAVSTISLSAGKNDHVKIPMIPEGFVKFYLVNTPPMDTVDGINVGDFDNTPNFSTISKDTFFTAYAPGNNMTHFSYTITDRNGVYHQHFDSVFVKALDTVLYTINY